MPSLAQRALNKARRIILRKTTPLRSPLRVAIIGYGGIGPDHMDFYEQTGTAQLVAVSDLSPGALAAALRRRPYLRGYRDYRHMIEEVKPDVVSICTWPQSHAQITRDAVAAGVKGILCEKPMALQLGELEEMVSLCAAKNVKLAIGHQYRWCPWYIRARELVAAGALGELRGVRGHIRGVMADNGPHLFDAVRFILGDPRAVEASCRCAREQGGFRQGMPAEESAEGEIVFDGGQRFAFVTGEKAPAFFGITLEGSKGSVELTPTSLTGTGDLQHERVEGRRDFQVRQFAEFIDWVKGRLPEYGSTGAQGSAAAEMMLALYDSVRAGTTVKLPPGNKGDVVSTAFPGAQAPAPPPASAQAAPSARVKQTPAAQRLAMHGGERAGRGAAFDCSPTFGKPEAVNLGKVLLSRKLSCTEGHVVAECQDEFARLYGAKHAVASTSGTAAIHVAVGALGLNPGDEVITTPLSDMGTVIPILACNCIPVFADVDPLTGNLTAETIAKKITARTKAVIVVHLFGRPVDLDPVVALLRPKGIQIIEDCAQAHYADYHGRKVGSIGDLGCFSLQQSKQITCGDGGITVTNRDDLAERAALFSDKGWLRSKAGRAGRNHYFLGMNYRMTELQGAVALAQAKRLPGFIRARRESADELTRLLKEMPAIVLPPDPAGTVPSWWIYAFAVDEAKLGASSQDFFDALIVEGVPLSRQYLPLALFEYDVIKHQRTYGTSGYPFTAFPYEPPKIEDFPGFTEFNRRMMLIGWSHNARPENARAIASAVRKAAAQLSC
ncbi:MAG: DegT/DnrJ/EryC1/StrS family aminotransferase [Verrucomicrobiaceae bacterium]|nr:DegT/DnrJ/EryC1/StrS family aminotransferase [Verrucomicrobiaceae bacterium]